MRKKRISNVSNKPLTQIHDNQQKYKYADFKISVAVGKYVTHFQAVNTSFLTAKDTLHIRWKAPQLSYFYEGFTPSPFNFTITKKSIYYGHDDRIYTARY